MCTTDGIIFNIDIDSNYLFGKVPVHKTMNNRIMYISTDILKCLGENSRWYQMFVSKCSKLYTRISKNVNKLILRTYIPMIRFVGINKNHIESHFNNRFITSNSDTKNKIVIKNLIRKSSNTTSSNTENFIDFIKIIFKKL